jgi:hypothetical protein
MNIESVSEADKRFAFDIRDALNTTIAAMMGGREDEDDMLKLRAVLIFASTQAAAAIVGQPRAESERLVEESVGVFRTLLLKQIIAYWEHE